MAEEEEVQLAALGQLNLTESPSSGSRCVDCFEKLEQIGEGTYGQVYMAREIKTGEIVALKRIRMHNRSEGFPKSAIREIRILQKLHHENVIKLKEVVTSQGPEKVDQGKPDGNKYKGEVYMVLEYMDHDLYGLANCPGIIFSVSQIKHYMKQLLLGLHYCHTEQVLHRDIKGVNVLIDNEGHLKLADFGLAREFANDEQSDIELAREFANDEMSDLTSEVITLWYRPPELLLGSTKYGPAVDMWSVGCIFAELLLGEPIFPGEDEPQQLDLIFKLCGSPDECNWPGVSKLCWYKKLKLPRPMNRRLGEKFRQFGSHALELLERMLTLDPSQRISARDARDATYFQTGSPFDPKSLPKYESSHEFQTRKKRQQQRQNEENAKRQRSQFPQPQAFLPHTPWSGSGKNYQMQAGPHQIVYNSLPPLAAGTSSCHSGRPHGPLGGLATYPPRGTSRGYNYLILGVQSGIGGYSSSSYPPRGLAPRYGSSGMLSVSPRDDESSRYGVKAPNYPRSGPNGGSGAGRGSDATRGNHNQ